MENPPCHALEYPAPELFSDQCSTEAVKWWTLGVSLRDADRVTPFFDEDGKEILRKIISGPLQLPDTLPMSAQDILAKLLLCDPKKRLGAKGASEIRAHPFFDGINWDRLILRGYKPTLNLSHTQISLDSLSCLSKIHPQQLLRDYKSSVGSPL